MSENGIVDQANQLILYVSRTILFRSSLDRHLIRAAMVFTFFAFSIQKWNQYTIEMLVPMISHSPSIRRPRCERWKRRSSTRSN